MIFTTAAQCRRCKHYRGDQSCDAYPDGIPKKLWTGDILHSKPFPGDHGIMLDWIQTPQFIMK